MIYIIYPRDSSTEFLLKIPSLIKEKHGSAFTIINIEASDSSYAEGLDLISQIPDNSIILFIGHGQDDLLFGAQSSTFEKKKFIDKSEIKVFSKKYLFSLSCYSSAFLHSTYTFSNIKNSIGFGSLPTEMTEVENNKKLKQQGINEVIIANYKSILVELVSSSFCDMIEKKESFYELSNYFMLRLNKKISQVILDDTKNNDNRILADLLFQMKTEMIFI